MIVSARIRERMTICELSQAELARRVGVTQGAIAKIAHNDPNGSSFLHRIARELGTTPAYLSGETDDAEADAPALPELSSLQREMLDRFSGLTPADQRALIQIARSMGRAGGADETVHERYGDFRGKEGNG